MARSQAELSRVRGELSWIQVDFDHATPASPAAWRLQEELDRLRVEPHTLSDLRNTAFVRGDATPGSPAQFRAQEEVDQLCGQLLSGS